MVEDEGNLLILSQSDELTCGWKDLFEISGDLPFSIFCAFADNFDSPDNMDTVKVSDENNPLTKTKQSLSRVMEGVDKVLISDNFGRLNGDRSLETINYVVMFINKLLEIVPQLNIVVVQILSDRENIELANLVESSENVSLVSNDPEEIKAAFDTKGTNLPAEPEPDPQ